jgi:hypothetical protein
MPTWGLYKNLENNPMQRNVSLSAPALLRVQARSDTAASRLGRLGATPIEGDLGSPEAWVAKLP